MTKGLDTNVIVRLYAGDSPDQALRAEKLIDRADKEELVLSVVCLAEADWVLRTVYGASKIQILEFLDELLAIPTLLIMNHAAVLAAVDAYRDGRAEFADYLIACLNESQGANVTYTFDKIALGDTRFGRVP